MNIEQRLKELEQAVHGLLSDRQSEIESEIKPVEWPQEGDWCWFVGRDGEPYQQAFNPNCKIQDYRSSIGETYRTEEEATKARDRKILIQELKRFADFAPDWDDVNQIKVMPYYNFSNKLWAYQKYYYTKLGFITDVVFRNDGTIEAALSHFGERLDLLLD